MEVSVEEASFVYRRDGKTMLAREPGDVPVVRRRAVVVRHPELPTSGEGSDRVFVANLETTSGGQIEVVERDRSYVEAVGGAVDAAAGAADRIGAEARSVAVRIASDPFLWRVRNDEGATIHLLGTIHSTKKGRLEDLAPQVREAYRASEMLVLETNLDRVERYLNRSGGTQLPEGESLRKKLTSDEYEEVRRALGDQFPERVIPRLQPWVVVTRIQMASERGATSMDEQLLQWAKVDDKKLDYLETPERHFRGIRRSHDIEALRQLLERDWSSLDGLRELRESYQQGDLEGIWNTLQKNNPWLEPGSKQHRALFTARNRDWVPKFDPLFEEEALVAVGVGHMTGPDNVLELLRDEGYEVERVP